MGRKKTNGEPFDPDMDGDGDGEVYVPASKVQSLPPPMPPPMSPDTEAERKTEDLWERMLGTDDVGTGYVAIHRLASGVGSPEEFVEKIPADKYDLDSLMEYLRDSCGPGDYRIRLYVKSGTGRFVMRGNMIRTIAKRSPTALPVLRDSGRQPNDMNNVLATFAAMQERSQQQMEAMMDRMMRRMEPVAQQKNSALEFVEILTALTAAVTPIATLVVQSRKRDADPIDGLAKILALTGQVKALTPEQQAAEAEPAWVGILKEGIKALPAVMAARAGQQRLALPNKAPPAQRPVSGPAVPPMPPLEEEVEIQGEGQEQPTSGGVTDRTAGDPNHPLYGPVCDLLDAAKQGAEPQDVAAQMLAQADPMQREVIGQFLSQDGLLKQLAAVHPDVMDEVEWFLDLRDEVLTLLNPQAEGYDPDTSNGVESENGAGG